MDRFLSQDQLSDDSEYLPTNLEPRIKMRKVGEVREELKQNEIIIKQQEEEVSESVQQLSQIDELS